MKQKTKPNEKDREEKEAASDTACMQHSEG